MTDLFTPPAQQTEDVTCEAAGAPDRGFSWFADDTVAVFEQPATAVYENTNGGIVIRQRGTYPFDGSEDQFVFFSSPDAVRSLIKALQREIGDA